MLALELGQRVRPFFRQIVLHARLRKRKDLLFLVLLLSLIPQN